MGDSARVREIYPDEAKEYMDRHEEGTYTLLDVRQPWEYEEAHLPGAMLLPLPQLIESLPRLDRAKPTIVYCAVGGRSRTAAQLLAHQGFAEVLHVTGGIEAWTEPTASSPVELHLEFVRGDESVPEVVRLGLQMEEGLRRFHATVKERTASRELAELLEHLIRAEESHKQTLLRLLPPDLQGETGEGGTAEGLPGDLMEGGIRIEEFIERNAPFLQSVTGYLDLAMMIETQALDLYLRMAGVLRDDAARRTLLRLAEEEKVHLAALGSFLDRQGRSS